ncbi:MAG TPA: cytochrome c peroxidase [Desulfuromonadales bacterium]|nr:cytochrome c peroxidase [Desulfuromonadales bacterium]
MKSWMRNPGTMSLAFAAALLAVLLPATAVREAQAQVAPSSSLKTVPVPEPANLARFVKDKDAAIRLGKALFWDMQLGSDGLMACASCHFHAGTDNRAKNTLRFGANGVFDVKGPNGTLTTADFPFHQMVNPDDRGTGGLDPDDPAVLRSVDDVVGAQGVPRTQLVGITEGQAVDRGRTLRDTPFASNGRNVRQVTGRNSPTIINAVFNFANFWDGRANHNFNGVNPFGVQDADATVWLNSGGALTPLSLVNADDPANQLDNASLASQAVGPPGDSTEMSWAGRSWPEIGRKMLSLRPLAKQAVHPQDSRLGPLRHPSGQGLATTYAAMIQGSFVNEFWDGAGTVTGGFTQMEANFSLFFGLAVQLYEATLVSDDTPFDRFAEGNLAALSESAQRGLTLFLSGGIGCFNCHVGAEFTSATVSMAKNPEEPGVVETMNMGNGGAATYDIGFYNIGVTPTAADLGRGGNDPFGNPLAFSRQRQIANGNAPGTLTFDTRFVPDQGCVPDLLGNPPLVCPPNLSTITRTAVNGNFKTPTLRNVELTGPYMHNGGMATLMQVVDFYTRGGNFHDANIADLDPFIVDLNGLKGNEAEQRALVDFLLALTDERVRQESAPFDHPQLFVAEGHVSSVPGNPKRTRLLADNLREIPAVGAPGRAAQGLPPLRPFLNEGGDPNFHYQP